MRTLREHDQPTEEHCQQHCSNEPERSAVGNLGTLFDQLMVVADHTIEWELGHAIPMIELMLDDPVTSSSIHFRRAGYVARHARGKLSEDHFQWYEDAPVVSRLRTLLDRLREVQV